jgi:pimeloyl-ACP methyl ester carboxylesterase
VVGESYGGFRAAALAARLPEDYGVELSGVVLVSPALELSLLEDDNYELLPSVLRLPSYAAAALTHGRLPPEVAAADPLAAAEAFALGELLPVWRAARPSTPGHASGSTRPTPASRGCRWRWWRGTGGACRPSGSRRSCCATAPRS